MTPATSVLLLLLLVPALVLGVAEHADGTVEHSARSRRALAIGVLHCIILWPLYSLHNGKRL